MMIDKMIEQAETLGYTATYHDGVLHADYRSPDGWRVGAGCTNPATATALYGAGWWGSELRRKLEQGRREYAEDAA